MISGTDANPLAEGMLILKTAHVRARFGNDLLCADPANSGGRVKSRDGRLVVVVQASLDHRVGLLDWGGLFADDVHHMGEEVALGRRDRSFKRPESFLRRELHVPVHAHGDIRLQR